ncbi:MAG: hypothetical protein CK548_07040 [Opitutia bacterium]|nr:MAG: hypothetical protein CK548_07040 [Opitutae bacterium]
MLLDGVKSRHRLRKGEAFSVEAGRAQVMVRIDSGDGTTVFHFPAIEPPADRDYADRTGGRVDPRRARRPAHGGGDSERPGGTAVGWSRAAGRKLDFQGEGLSGFLTWLLTAVGRTRVILVERNQRIGS